MGFVDYVMKIGASLNPQLEAQVIGSGIASSFRRYATIISIILVAIPLALSLLIAVMMLPKYPLYVAVTSAAGSALIAVLLILALYISIPSLAAKNREDLLERRFLLLATMLASMIFSGVGIGEAFLKLGRNVPPELEPFRLELEYIASLLSTGRPVHEALESAARITPSQTLRSLFMGLAAAARTGTGVVEALDATVSEYLSVRETEVDRITNSLGALLEFYMTIAVMLPIGIGVVGLLLAIQPIKGLSFNLLLALTSFLLVPTAVVTVVILAESIASRIKG